MWVEDCSHDPRADSKECSRAGSRIVTFRFPPIISDSTLIQCNTMDNDPQLNESLKGEIGAIYRQGGITCGAINEPRKSSKAIDERVIINFRDKNVVNARFRDKNVVIARFHDKNVVIARFRDKNVVIARFCDKNGGSIDSHSD